jgi:hypothetical protein
MRACIRGYITHTLTLGSRQLHQSVCIGRRIAETCPQLYLYSWVLPERPRARRGLSGVKTKGTGTSSTIGVEGVSWDVLEVFLTRTTGLRGGRGGGGGLGEFRGHRRRIKRVHLVEQAMLGGRWARKGVNLAFVMFRQDPTMWMLREMSSRK